MNEETERETGSPDAGRPPRSTSHRALRDVPSLQALAHPTRLALLKAIGLAGAMTATQASRVVGESPTACAYHLRMLARLGFVEEAGGGHGRERPWRLVPTSMTIDEESDDPAVAKAAKALTAVLIEQLFAEIRHFELVRARYPADVRAATEMVQSIVFATAQEMADLKAELIALLYRYSDRMDPSRRPHYGHPFEVVVFTHVIEMPGVTPGTAPPPTPSPSPSPAPEPGLGAIDAQPPPHP